ncbi:hypothetical protein TNCV_1930241 [Trichonephila clavipes]|nr:hypothetical protein TNCV_1930241 [Trichonephila clavipes]
MGNRNDNLIQTGFNGNKTEQYPYLSTVLVILCLNPCEKVTDSWSACDEFDPSTVEDSPCRGVMRIKSVEAQTSSILVFYSHGVFPCGN